MNKSTCEYLSLDSICTKGSSNISINKLNDCNGIYPLYGASGFVKDIDFFHQEKPYIGIVKDGAGVGRVSIYPAKSSLVGTMQYIIPSSKCTINYLYHFLCSLNLSKFVSGATIPHIYFKDYGKCLIPIPTIEEQGMIASELDMITEMISKYDEQLKELDKLSQSIFYEMFGDPVENEKGWEVNKLEEISREIGDGLHGTPVYTQYNTGYFFINGNNLENGVICIKENTKMVSEDTKCKYHIDMDTSTILVSINGTLGKTAIYNGENVILGKSACYIKLNSDVNKVYIHEIIKSDYFKKYANDESTGTTIKNVSLKSMRHFPIILPPLPLQQSFARKIEAIEAMKSKVKEAKKEAETLLAARMQYWFE